MKASNILLTGLLLAASASRADLIAGWDFQTTTTGGTAITAAPGSPLVYNANVGLGSIYLNGSNGSSTWTSTTPNPQVTGFTGSNLNTSGTGFSTATTSPACLALANTSANGFQAVFAFSMLGYENLILSYATQRTGTGFTSQAWEYSNDGSLWAPVQTFATIPASFGVLTTGAITGLNNDSSSYLRLTVTGASSASGNNRLDNIQLNAVAAAVPEPATAGLLAIGLALLRLTRRIR